MASILDKLIQRNKECLYPLQSFMPNGLPNMATIHIVGKEESGKTSLAINFVKQNPGNIFVYIDTYFKIKAEQSNYDNMYLYRTNCFEDIYEYLKGVEENHVKIDYLIIDSISNILFRSEIKDDFITYIDNRYVIFTNSFRSLIDLCNKLKIKLILLNTINGQGCPYNVSYQLESQFTMDMTIEDTTYIGNNNYKLTIKSSKNKYADFYTQKIQEIILKD